MQTVTTKLFKNGPTQAVRLPKDVAFPKGVTDVEILVSGRARIVVPKGSKWDWFFSRDSRASDDFMVDREQGEAEERELF